MIERLRMLRTRFSYYVWQPVAGAVVRTRERLAHWYRHHTLP